MTIRRVGVDRLPVGEIRANPLSANVEDGATYARLKREIEEHGLLELPLVLKKDNSYQFLAGQHRAKAWQELGHDSIDVLLVEGEMSPEEEFNLVNNLNQIRGTVTLANLKRVIRKHELAIEQLDVFKYPVSRLIPKLTAQTLDSDLARRARIRDMSLQIAAKVAESLLDDINESVVVFRVKDKIAAVVRVNLTKSAARKNASILKRHIKRSFDAWLDDESPDNERVKGP